MSVKKWTILTVSAALLAIVGFTSLYVVPVYEYAVVTQFGKVVATQTEPGLYFKMPFIQRGFFLWSVLKGIFASSSFISGLSSQVVRSICLKYSIYTNTLFITKISFRAAATF